MKIPTAEKFLNDFELGNTQKIDVEDAQQAIIEFAKLHVQAALKAADEKAIVTPIDHEEIAEGSFRPIWGVDSDSILNSYPLDRIK